MAEKPKGKRLFSGKRVLVTGGTGSFGHQIVDRLLEEGPEEIRIFSRDEDKQVRMSEEYGMGHQYPKKASMNFVIGDIRNPNSVRQAMRGIDVVFHAAALKQVPLCEYHVWEAVQTNIIGAQNVIQAAIEEEVEKVIAISTDKAVKPVNAMGMTKAIQEKLFTAANFHKAKKRTVFACVRYGNVVGSRGSVIPLFKRQIESGGPVTITDPERTLLDGLSMPQYCGDFAELLHAFEVRGSGLNVQRIIEYALKLDAAAAKRLGWVLERQGVEPSRLETLASLPIKGYRKLDPTGPRKGPCSARWMIQENLPGKVQP